MHEHLQQVRAMMTTPAEHAEGFKMAKRMAKRLLQQYARWDDEVKCIYWTWYGARDAYYLLCDKFRLRREA